MTCCCIGNIVVAIICIVTSFNICNTRSQTRLHYWCSCHIEIGNPFKISLTLVITQLQFKTIVRHGRNILVNGTIQMVKPKRRRKWYTQYQVICLTYDNNQP